MKLSDLDNMIIGCKVNTESNPIRAIIKNKRGREFALGLKAAMRQINKNTNPSSDEEPIGKAGPGPADGGEGQ